MADDINKKISIDVQVSSDGQQQVDNYKKAFDDLRDSVGNLGKPIADLSNNIRSFDKDINKLTETVSKLNSRNQDFVSTGDKVLNKLKDLYSSYSTLKDIITDTELASDGWAGAIAAGVLALIQFAPKIADWISSLTEGNTRLTALAKAMKDYNIIMGAVSQAQQQGNNDAQQELVHLNLLYKASQDRKASLQDRKRVIAELKNEYPAYFKNLSEEQIMTGKASKAYNDLANSIIAASKARAAEEIMVKNNIRQFGNNDTLKKLTPQLIEYSKQLKQAQKDYDDYTAHPPIGGGTVPVDTEESNDYQKLADLRELVKKTAKQIADLKTDNSLLNGQNKALVDSVIKDTENYGVTVLNVSKQASTAQVKAINTTTTTQQEALIKQLQASRSIYAQEALDENKRYNEQKQRLDKLLKDKEISLQQYNDEVKKLAADHNDAISDLIDKYVKDDKTKDQSKELVAMSLGAKDIENKINEVNVVRINRETKLQDDISEAAKKAAKERADFEKQTAQDVSKATFSIITKSIQQQSEARIKSLENEKNAELSNTSLTSAQRLAIQNKYKKQEDALKLKAFKEEQEASIAQAIINGALAITKAEAQTGVLGTFAIPAIIAQTAIQIATIAAQKPPAMAKGGYFRSDGKGAVLPGYSRTDNTNAYLRSGEAVVVSEAMRDPWARNLVSAINVAYGGRDFSVPNLSRGYAVGGIFTDGGNANRYYNQPMNDNKNLANTIAYQMINNFPPVYVDVKDINNQQNILAQTINRVNL
ncbi:MAG TPA: hypothetical protein VHB54_13920 [Mucilaginibacter sp.]|nr:hypothetical protein [Mucilaginibacter sp.]